MSIYCSRCRQCVKEEEVESITQAPRHGLHTLCGGLVRFDDDLKPIDWQTRALAAEQERDQLKAELQQAREALELLCKTVVKDGQRSESYQVKGFALAVLLELRAILERIEKI